MSDDWPGLMRRRAFVMRSGDINLRDSNNKNEDKILKAIQMILFCINAGPKSFDFIGKNIQVCLGWKEVSLFHRPPLFPSQCALFHRV